MPALYTRLITTRFPGHAYMCVLITERSFDLQAMYVCNLLATAFCYKGTIQIISIRKDKQRKQI